MKYDKNLKVSLPLDEANSMVIKRPNFLSPPPI